MNVYQELFTTKLYEKLCPQSTGDATNQTMLNTYTNTADIRSALMNFTFSEGFFEKIALIEFESSIYNQLNCSKILYHFYQQIVCNEIKLIKNKSPRTIVVNPVNESSVPGIDRKDTRRSDAHETFFNSSSAVAKNIKHLNKKLSLTICDFGKKKFILGENFFNFD